MTADPRTLAAHLRELWQTLLAKYGLDAPPLLRCATFIESTLPMWDAWQTAKPPCTTCDGKEIVFPDGTRLSERAPCPACVDHPGVQPFTEWVAGVIAVWMTIWDDRLWQLNSDPLGVVAHLRQLGGTR